MTKRIAIDRVCDGRLLRLTLDAPKANIIDAQMMGELADALRDAGADPQLRAVAFEGAGGQFSFGASVEEHQRDVVAGMLARFSALFRQLLELSLPSFAVVRGQCLGGGMELASWCTWVFAGEDARFAQPEIKLGVFAPIASVLLPWRLGGGHALDLCVSGRGIGAREAHRIGLVTEVADDPWAAARAFFEEHVAGSSASSLRFAERAARATLAPALADTLDRVERMYVDELMATPDANAGIEAFLARKRRS